MKKTRLKTIDQILGIIGESHTIAVCSHMRPDGDCIGSTLGLALALLDQGKEVICWNQDPVPAKLQFLDPEQLIQSPRPIKRQFDCVIAVDSASIERLGTAQEHITNRKTLINIDHHKSNEMYGDYNIIDPEAASTSQVAYDFLRTNGQTIGKESALCFYTALVDDTGFFKYDSVDAGVFAFAKELVEAGAEPGYVANMLTMREPLAKLRLIPLVLQTLELVLDAQVAIITLTQQMLAATGATKEMADDALQMARSLATVEVAVLLRQEEDGRIKVSLRSKNFVDVSCIALDFGGGGHKRAAGFTSHLHDFDKVKAAVLEKIEGVLVEAQKK